MISGEFQNEVLSKCEKWNLLEMSSQQLEEGNVWNLFLFWNSFFDFFSKKESTNQEKLNLFCKNLIFKLKIENKEDQLRLAEIEKFNSFAFGNK